MTRALVALAFVFALGACRSQGGRDDTSEQPPASPQANAVPVPLTTVPTPPAGTTASSSPDAGPPPDMPRPLTPFPADGMTRDGPGYTLALALRFPEAPVVARGDIPVAAIEAARKKTDPALAVDLTPARARVVLRGKGFLVPDGTEIRMRSDVYGGVLVDPGGAVYRTLAPGTMRAVLGERRFDVGPLTPAEITPAADGARRLGYPTRKVDVWTRAAKASFEMARVQDVGEGGVLLCRFFLDWMSAPPSTPLCDVGEIPLHAELRWAPRGVMIVDAFSILRRLDVAAANVQTPPANARFSNEPLGTAQSGLFFTPAELTALRPGGETARLVLTNGTEETRIAWADGVPLGWLAPGARVDVQGMPKAKVVVEWRTFLDDADKPAPQSIALPGTSDASGADAGL